MRGANFAAAAHLVYGLAGYRPLPLYAAQQPRPLEVCDDRRPAPRDGRGPDIRRCAARARLLRCPAGAGRRAHAADPGDRARHSPDLGRHGHGHRGAHGHRHGAAWRASASCTRTWASRSRRARSSRSRSSRPAWSSTRSRVRPGDAAGRGARPDAAARHLRPARGRGAERPAGRHPHQPRRALRAAQRAAGARADDRRAPDHRARGRRPRPRPWSCCTSTGSRSCWWSTTPTAWSG